MAARAHQALLKVARTHQQQLVALIEPAKKSADAISMLSFLATATLDAAQTNSQATPLSLGDFLIAIQPKAQELLGHSEEFSVTTDSDNLLRQLWPLVGELESLSQEDRLPDTVVTAVGHVRFIDYLRTNLILLTRTAYDLGQTPTREALAESTRAMLTVLAERFPGRSIEVRVPPFAATQVGAIGNGPKHTRGTPPNVVECQSDIFFDLATGRTSFAQAKQSGKMTSSGAHADEAENMFPIIQI